MTKEAVIGKPLFEAHPGNPNDPSDNGVQNLRASLDADYECKLRYKGSDWANADNWQEMLTDVLE